MLLRRAVLIQGAAMCSPFFLSLAQAQSQASMDVVRYAHVRYVHGGMSDWAKRGWPMVKP